MRWSLARGYSASMLDSFKGTAWMSESETGLEGLVSMLEDRRWPRESELLVEYRESDAAAYRAYWKEAAGLDDPPSGIQYIAQYVSGAGREADFAAFCAARPRLATDSMDDAALLDRIVSATAAPLLEGQRKARLCIYRDSDMHCVVLSK